MCVVILKYRKKIKKTSQNQNQQLREIYSFAETQTQEIYSYAIWLSGNEVRAEKIIEKALEQVTGDICVKFKDRQIKSEFFKALEFQCKLEKLALASNEEKKQPSYKQGIISVSFRNVLGHMPKRYSELLIMRVLDCLSITELAQYFSITESEVLMRLSAARKIVSVLASRELTVDASVQAKEIQNTSMKYINDLIAEHGNNQAQGQAI